MKCKLLLDNEAIIIAHQDANNEFCNFFGQGVIGKRLDSFVTYEGCEEFYDSLLEAYRGVEGEQKNILLANKVGVYTCCTMRFSPIYVNGEVAKLEIEVLKEKVPDFHVHTKES